MLRLLVESLARLRDATDVDGLDDEARMELVEGLHDLAERVHYHSRTGSTRTSCSRRCTTWSKRRAGNCPRSRRRSTT